MALLEHARPLATRAPLPAERPAPGPAPGRIAGVDIARGVAVLGIVGAHLTPRQEFSWHPASWIAQGHAPVLFVLLAGLTVGLATRGGAADIVALRTRIMTQAVLIFVLGGLLAACNIPITGILPAFAVMLALCLPVLSWPIRKLLVLAAVCAIAGPVLVRGLPSILRFFGQVDSQPINIFITGTHPVAVWLAYMLVGLAIGRANVAALAGRLALLGTGLTVAGYSCARLLTHLYPASSLPPATDRRVPYPSDGTALPPGIVLPENTPPLPDANWRALSRAEPFSNTPFAVLCGTGCALLILAAALALRPQAQRALKLVAIAGTMALSVYTAHFAAIFLLDPRHRVPGSANPLADPSQHWMGLAVIAILLAGAHAWWRRAGRGPVEQLLAWAADRASQQPTKVRATRATAGRVTGIDIARGVAVLGMFTAHLSARTRALSWTDPISWLSLVHGRSSILFALLAGVSLGLLVRGRAGRDPVALRLWVLVRAALIFGIGGILLAFGTQIAIILQVYALMFVLCVPLLAWPRRRLLMLAACCAVAGPVLVVWLPSVLRFYPRLDSQPVDVGLTGIYPAVVWMTYVLVGLVIGRSDLSGAASRARLAGAGAALMVAGYGTAWLIGFLFHPSRTAAAAPVSPDPRRLPLPGDSVVLPPGSSAGEGAPTPLPAPFWEGLLTADPHTNTTFEAAGSTGFALLVLAIALSLGRIARKVLYPVAAVGAMALTAYIGQVIAIFFISPRTRIPHVSHPLVDPAQNWLILTVITVTLAIAAGWQLICGRGPVEFLLKKAGDRATTAPVRIPAS